MNSIRRKNLIRYILPAMLSNCSLFLLTIVDGVFVGHGVGTDALGAVNLAFPFVMLLGALFTLTTIGGVTVAAVRLGRGDDEGANAAFMHALAAAGAIAAALCLVGLLGTDALARLLGANETYHDMVVDYLFWYSAFILPSGLLTCFAGFCRNDGSPVLASAAAIVATAVNIFGDWLLVFPLQMGLAGAAIASGVSQTVALLVVLPHFLLKKGRLRLARCRLKAALFGKLVLRGLPEMVSQFATPVMTLCMNYVLLGYLGDEAVNAFSIIGYVSSLFFSLFYGAAGGLQPLFGRSYGAREEGDLRYYFRRGLAISVVGAAGVFALTLVMGGAVCRLFGADEATYALTVEALPRFSLNFLFASATVILSSYLYSTKRTKWALALNIWRSLLFSSLLIFLLPALFGSGVIWYSVAVAEALSLVAALVLWRASERGGLVFR